jgi:hypothetical protein
MSISLRRRRIVQEDTLKSIDRKLTGVIALLARQVTGGGTTGIESFLRRTGMSTAEIASILDKSQRAVQLALKDQGYKE